MDSETGNARTLKIFIWLPATDIFEYRGNSWLLNKISSEKGITMDRIMKDITRRKRLLMWMVENNVTDIQDASRYLTLCRKDPEKIESLISQNR